MPSFIEATVAEILHERKGLQRISVNRNNSDKPELAYVLTQLIGPVAIGDRVVVNTTAVELQLGTGGFHFVHWNLSRDEWREPGPGHIMKLRYTSLQVDAGATEESDDYTEPSSLKGMPVVVCLLLSQIAAVAASAKKERPDVRIVFVMNDQASLSIALSDLVFDLTNRGLIDATVTTGQAFGGDYEAVNFTSGLGVAFSVAKADLVIACQGFGMVGSGTSLGFSGLAAVEMLESARSYGARPIFALRGSKADERSRHKGISHHSKAVIERTSDDVIIALPEGLDAECGTHHVSAVETPDLTQLFEKFDLNVETMGRSFHEDPFLFQLAAAAGVVAARSLPAQ